VIAASASHVSADGEPAPYAQPPSSPPAAGTTHVLLSHAAPGAQSLDVAHCLPHSPVEVQR
jgi:hypothetical protein